MQITKGFISCVEFGEVPFAGTEASIDLSY